MLNFSDTSVAFINRTTRELKIAELIFKSFNSPLLVKIGSETMLSFLALGLPVKGIVKNTVFRQFCGGENIQNSLVAVENLGKYGVGSILDYSVEGQKSEEGFEAAAKEIMATIDQASSNSNIPFSVFKVSGVADVEVLKRIQKGSGSKEDNSAFMVAKERIHKICQHAYEKKVRIFVDAEETWIQDVIDDLAIELSIEFNRDSAIVYNTYQMYRVDAMDRLRKDFNKAAEKGIFLGAKLVRGAYMEKEREKAEKEGYDDPINPNKPATDDLFNKGMIFCLNNKQRIALCAATHNEESCALLAEAMEKHSLNKDDERVFFAQLYGMSDHISFNLAKEGYNVAKYLPYGPIKYVMPYLVRRAEENRSVAGQSSREMELVRTELRRRKKSR